VARAAAEARRLDPTLQLAEMLVVGDTPHDIEGARHAGIPTLALATNTHTVEELESHQPWLTLPALPDAEAFLALLAQRFQPTTA
jgi:phosphoglycolate phosphatase-like HAD superfamily hydrolase